MDTTRCLRDEHRLILQVLDCFEIALHRAERAGQATQAVFAPFIEFFRGFADRCHHCKEEDRLFPCLERCGIPREGGPLEMMVHEHRVGRAYITAIDHMLPAADSGDPAATASLLDHGRRFLDLLRHHIMKEDHALFEMADQVVNPSERLSLTQAYAEAESDPEYQATFDRCREIAAGLIGLYSSPEPQRA